MENETKLADGDTPDHSPFLNPKSQIEITKRNLPHWQFDGGFYFVTWRLADSLPQELLHQWLDEKRDWLYKHPKPWDAVLLEEYRRLFPRRMNEWLDAGYGGCALRDPCCAAFVVETMRHFDGQRYDMACYIIMPNHVHALFQLRGDTRVTRVLQTWKGYSARRINERLGKRGSLWQQESRDTSIRDPVHLVRCYTYIRENPDKARLREGEYVHYEAPGFKAQLCGWSGDFDGE